MIWTLYAYIGLVCALIPWLARDWASRPASVFAAVLNGVVWPLYVAIIVWRALNAARLVVLFLMQRGLPR